MKKDIRNYFSLITRKAAIGLFLFTLLVGSCSFSLVNNVVEKLVPESEITLTVQPRQANEKGGKEVWITQLESEGKRDLFRDCVNGQKAGVWEYRDAKTYGYGYNFLISYGDNTGSTMKFSSKELANKEIIIWKNVNSGKITVKAGNTEQNIDLYSEVSGGEFLIIFPFKDSKTAFIFKAFLYIPIYIIVFILLALIYVNLLKGVKIPQFINRTWNFKNTFFLFVILYIYDIVQYKIGIPNFLQFGDQNYYWGIDSLFNNIQEYANSLYSFRGYICNFIPIISKTIGKLINVDAVWIYFVFTAIATSSLLGFIMPKLHELLFNKKVKVYQTIILTLIFVAFWNGMLTAVLVDLFGVTCFLCGIMFAIWYLKDKKLYFAIFSGITLSASISYRTSYQFTVMLLVILVIVITFIKLFSSNRIKLFKCAWIDNISYKQIIIGILAFSASFILVCVPQIQINNIRGHAGFFPYDEKGSLGFDTELSLTERSANGAFTYGITGYPYQVSDNQIPHMKSEYSNMDKLLNNNQLFDLFVSRPVDTLIYIGKKLFAGFDVKTNITYPQYGYQIHTIYYVFSFVNYFVIACALYALLFFKSSKKEKFIFGLIFITQILTQTYVHVEWRYFIVGYLILYYYAAYKFSTIIEDSTLFKKIVSGNFLYYLCGYVYFSQWISLTFYG